MAIAKYPRTCSSANVPGNSKIFIADVSNITSITSASGEISAISGALAFKEIDADPRTIQVTGEGKTENQNTFHNLHVLFSTSLISVASETLKDSIIDGARCGLVVLVVDNNGKGRVHGYCQTNGLDNALTMVTANEDTGGKISDSDVARVSYDISDEVIGSSLFLDATLIASVLDGTATWIDFN